MPDHDWRGWTRDFTFTLAVTVVVGVIIFYAFPAIRDWPIYVYGPACGAVAVLVATALRWINGRQQHDDSSQKGQ